MSQSGLSGLAEFIETGFKYFQRIFFHVNNNIARKCYRFPVNMEPRFISADSHLFSGLYVNIVFRPVHPFCKKPEDEYRKEELREWFQHYYIKQTVVWNRRGRYEGIIPELSCVGSSQYKKIF